MSAARYFQGSSVHGPVQASAARMFKEVVDALRVAPVLGIGHKAFLALGKKQRNEIKQVPFFVPATFHNTPSKRTYEQAVHCNLIFLDIDELPDGRCPAAPFLHNPELLHEALAGFNFAAHLTASSTPEKPRMRIIVDAEEIPLSEYPKAVATIGSLLGLPSITRESSVAVQPMFLPTLFNDSPADFSPLIAFEVQGRTFLRSDVADSLDSFHGVNGANGKNGHSEHLPPADADALDFLRAPVPEISLGIIKEVLAAIDPDLSYPEWFEVAAALKHQFSPHKDEEAFELFDEWSKEGSKYGGHEETLAKWKSARPSPNGRLPVTVRSLLRRGVAAGWDDKRVRENLLSVTTRWFETTESVMDLVEKGVQRILATPLLGSMQEDMLINELSKQAKRRFSHTITPTAIRKDLNRLKAEVKAHEEPPAKVKEPLWAKDVVYVIAADEFFRYRTGEKIKTQAFNSAYGRHLMPTKAQLQARAIATGVPTTPRDESTPMVKPSEYALNKLLVPTFQDYAYNPALPNDKMFVVHGTKLLNTYNPTYPSPDWTRAKEAGELLQKHLSNLIAEPEYRRMLLDFMAYQVQAPGRKVRYAVLIQSVEGAGKTFLAEVMKAVLGAEHVKMIDGASIKSGWNEWSFGSQLVVLEEVKVSGTSKYEIMNSLKPLITNDDISINERFRNTRQVANISNYMIFSNHHDALALTPGDRRYFVIKSPLQSKAQVLALGDDYFPPLYAMLRDHPGAMRAYLLDWEISADFRPDGHAPRTKYVTDMVNDSASDLTTTVRRLLLEGDFPMIQYDIVSTSAIKDVLHQVEGMNRVTAAQIAQVLREEGLHQVGRHLIGDDRHYVWARAGISEQEAVAAITMRVKKSLKNLSMELLF
jgi:hypothetical protein